MAVIGCGRTWVVAGLLATTAMAGPALAQDAPTPDAVAGPDDQDADSGDIIVTALKRAQNLQDVPLAITAITTETLENLQVQDFDDYARYLPSLSYQATAPGFSNVYFRGVASGENANHSAQLPSVGTYLDEAPITTIQGALDIHVYDVARVEALAGPQGTLYGASSQAGTVRIITNKPDTSGFYGSVDGEVNFVAHGGTGYVAEGFVNVPLSQNAAIRVVGWYDKDAGYIDNVRGTRVFPTLGPDFDVPGTNTVTNDAFVEENYNDTETYGGRAALKIDLDDNWTVTPQIMGQRQISHGSFAYQRGLGRLEIEQYNPERVRDEWYQAALTIEGKIGSFDVTYAGAYMARGTLANTDYSDYAYYYDALFGYGAYYVDNDGNPLSNQRVIGDDRYTKQSHELRLNWESGPARIVGGLFYQRQTHNIGQDYVIDGLSDDLSFSSGGTNASGVDFVDINKPDTLWYTKQFRVDRDYAAFGEITVEITDKLEATLGTRIFRYDNSLVGFFGYTEGFSGGTGIGGCFAGPVVEGSPCTNLDKSTADTDFIHKLNLTYKFTDDALVYGTVSRGFRPGGLNRRGTLPPFRPDFIDNYEIGWKTSFADNRVTWNGAAYLLKWSDIQFSYLGANVLTEIRNAGDGEIKGVEMAITARPVDGLNISLSGAYTDATLTTPYCRIANPEFDCSLPGPEGQENFIQAPEGTRLPITPEFKANAQARYEFPVGADSEAFVQAAAVYQSDVLFDLRTIERAILGTQQAYTTVDLTGGVSFGNIRFEVYARNVFDVLGGTYRNAQCAVQTCGDTTYIFPLQPRTIGIRAGTKF